MQDISRRKPCIKNFLDEPMEKVAFEFAIDKPAYGQLRVFNELKKRGIFISLVSKRGIWLRHDMETFAKRLKALVAKSAKENFLFTEDPLKALDVLFYFFFTGLLRARKGEMQKNYLR